jgi:hypothetical protein
MRPSSLKWDELPPNGPLASCAEDSIGPQPRRLRTSASTERPCFGTDRVLLKLNAGRLPYCVTDFGCGSVLPVHHLPPAPFVRLRLEVMEHSRTEPRFYCLRRVADGVSRSDSPTAQMSFALSVPDSGARARNSMKHTRKYTKESLGRVEVVEDFLPPPDQMAICLLNNPGRSPGPRR